MLNRIHRFWIPDEINVFVAGLFSRCPLIHNSEIIFVSSLQNMDE